MFDNLRDMSDDSGMYEEPEETYEEEPVLRPAPEVRVMGMTAGQRLVLSFLLLATVIMMGAMCLLVTGKLWFY